MSRRFLHRWLGHWSLMLLGMVVVQGVWLTSTGNGLVAGSLVVSLIAFALVGGAWLCTRAGGEP